MQLKTLAVLGLCGCALILLTIEGRGTPAGKIPRRQLGAYKDYGHYPHKHDYDYKKDIMTWARITRSTVGALKIRPMSHQTIATAKTIMITRITAMMLTPTRTTTTNTRNMSTRNPTKATTTAVMARTTTTTAMVTMVMARTTTTTAMVTMNHYGHGKGYSGKDYSYYPITTRRMAVATTQTITRHTAMTTIQATVITAILTATTTVMAILATVDTATATMTMGTAIPATVGMHTLATATTGTLGTLGTSLQRPV
ncbi:hypothetical protein Plhal304r1_c071g0160131 [Plasmopara halstedii]